MPRGTVRTVADHIDHIVRLAGVDHVGYGSDFDGVTSLPVGLEDVSRFPYLTAELLRRGYSDADVRKILGGNILRVMRQAEAVAARLQRERPPSTALIDVMDGGLVR
jgi:membrane dipeptidase